MIIYLLLGGLVGPDGSLDSKGIASLADRFPEHTVKTYYWSSYKKIINDIRNHNQEIVLIGYSGGGSRVTWIASAVYPREIELLISYDPSPSWQMTPLRSNVKKAICYHNNAPMMFGLGGGELSGKHVENIEISEQHMAVQYDQRLHQITLDAIKHV